MKVAVWDTYVKRKDGLIMHFDIIVPEETRDEAIIYGYGKDYLFSKGQGELILSSKQCQFCHIEEVKSQWVDEISRNGYYIYEMENCS